MTKQIATYTDGTCTWTLDDLTDPASWAMPADEARRVDALGVGESTTVDGGDDGPVTLTRVS